MWIQEPLNYDKHALCGVSHWGRKRQQFYGFAVNRESALDVYSKRRIIAVTDLKIVVMMIRSTNLKKAISKGYASKTLKISTCGRYSTGSRKLPEEAQPYNARHVSIQSKATRSVYCLFVPKKIYLSKQGQEKQRREAYTAYSYPRGFIYQNKDTKNRLMRIDELHKFSDGTLNDVRNALDDRLKGIRMQYLPTTIWRKGDKDRAAAMI
nr:hypothetical protein [Tanacetum cinerariifolium]